MTIPFLLMPLLGATLINRTKPGEGRKNHIYIFVSAGSASAGRKALKKIVGNTSVALTHRAAVAGVLSLAISNGLGFRSPSYAKFEPPERR